jgi:TetR/AcrR family transcriptional regulator, acrAB operon repressor
MMPRRTKEEADITRQTLLRAALVVFSRQGYSATRLEDIAAEAGVTRGAIYHHFGSKPELYTEMVVEYNKPIMQIVMEAIAEGGTFVDILRRQFIRLCAAIEDDPDLRAIQEIATTKTEMTPELAEGIATKLQSMDAQLEFLTEGFAQAIENGELRATLDPKQAALAYFSCLNGYALLWLLDQSAFSIKNDAPGIVEIFLQGVLAPSKG